MDKKIQQIAPNYQLIYQDIINERFPEKQDVLKKILSINSFSAFDILQINKMIFGKESTINHGESQKYRSYKKSDIINILNYQKQHNLTNIKVAQHFGISRNSITKWKKIYLI